MKKLIRLATGAFTAASFAVLGASPAFAANIDLCKSAGTTGFAIPCGGDITQIINFVVNVLLFAAFVLALIFLVIGGIRWIMSGGDKEATGKAKSTVTSALIGLVVVIAAWVLINIVLNLLTGSNLGSLELKNLNQQQGSGSGGGGQVCVLRHPANGTCLKYE